MNDDRLNYDRGYFYTDPTKAGLDAIRDAGIKYHTKMVVCDRCDGKGVRALHGIALSGDTLDDHEFMEDYMKGRYDTPCDDCGGRNVREVLDRKSLSPRGRKIYDDAVRNCSNYNAESLAELRAGA